jgi:hypothetical protein
MGPVSEVLGAGAFAVALLAAVGWVNSPAERAVPAAAPVSGLASADEPTVHCGGKSTLVGQTVYDDGGQLVGTVKHLMLSEDRSLCFVLLAPEGPNEWGLNDRSLMLSDYKR